MLVGAWCRRGGCRGGRRGRCGVCGSCVLGAGGRCLRLCVAAGVFGAPAARRAPPGFAVGRHSAIARAGGVLVSVLLSQGRGAFPAARVSSCWPGRLAVVVVCAISYAGAPAPSSRNPGPSMRGMSRAVRGVLVSAWCWGLSDCAMFMLPGVLPRGFAGLFCGIGPMGVVYTRGRVGAVLGAFLAGCLRGGGRRAGCVRLRLSGVCRGCVAGDLPEVVCYSMVLCAFLGRRWLFPDWRALGLLL